jgi:hypothetical protein
MGRSVEVIPNFLPTSQFLALKELIYNPLFAWYWNDQTTTEGDCQPQLTHTYFSDDIWWSESSHIMPILTRLNVFSLARVKLNLQPPVQFPYKTQSHVDFHRPEMTTSILYITTNEDAFTYIGDEKISTVENTLVRFQTDTPHYGETSSKKRILMNLNYWEHTQ